MSFLLALLPFFAADQELPYVELSGVVRDFQFHRQWRSYYWREDFTLVLRDDQGKDFRIISREPTPWTDLRLGTTFTGLEVDWKSQPRVRVIGVRGVDRTPVEFYDLKLDAPEPPIVTAFILRVKTGDAWRDYYVNNWFHSWGAATGPKVVANYATADPNYTVFGYLGGISAPFDAAGQKQIDQQQANYGGIIYHARVVKAAQPAGYELQLLHLMGRHKKTLEYEVFFGDPKSLVKLDQRKP